MCFNVNYGVSLSCEVNLTPFHVDSENCENFVVESRPELFQNSPNAMATFFQSVYVSPCRVLFSDPLHRLFTHLPKNLPK